MQLHIHHYRHLDQQIENRLVRIETNLDHIRKGQETIMATLAQVLEKVREADTKQDSITALIVGLKQRLDDALSGVTLPPAVQAQVDEVFSQAEKNVAEIDESIAANTPPAP